MRKADAPCSPGWGRAGGYSGLGMVAAGEGSPPGDHGTQGAAQEGAALGGSRENEEQNRPSCSWKSCSEKNVKSPEIKGGLRRGPRAWRLDWGGGG